MTTVYLDFANWSQMGRNPNSDITQAFLDSVDKQLITVCFSSAHLYDAAVDDNDRRRRQVAGFMESASRRGDSLWVRPFNLVRDEELVAGYVQYRLGEWKSPNVFASNRFDLFQNEYVPDPREAATIPEFIESLRDLDVFRKYSDWREDYPERRQFVSQVRDERGSIPFSEREIRSWLKEDLPDVIESPEGIRFPLTERDKEAFANEVDWRSWPLTSTLYAFHEGWNQQPSGAQPSDVVDSFHLVGVAYCDVAFADNDTVDVLALGGLDHLPRRNGEFEGWVRELREGEQADA